uniref:Ephrin type-A receptor 5-like n=1 Tax=Saccoglossus kowalevskii TaxID=10224 RepID=A0ABM0MQ84_SACKO|nr:PREDICTED: ephrin type-A receptor 5-like [Saccoglossus kowalevskii]
MCVYLNCIYLWKSVAIIVCLHYVKGDCTEFPDTQNAFSTLCTLGTNYGSTCTFECLNGYTESSLLVATCYGTTWTVNPIVCRVVTCPAIITPSNGGMSCTPESGTGYNTVCTFTCDAGYTSSGSSSRTCQSDGQWSGSDFTCTVVTCPTVSVPSHGGMSCSPATGTDYNTKCTFTCDTGYTPSGSVSRTCQSTGQWSGSEFACTAVTCPIIMAPTYGNIACTQDGSVTSATNYTTECTFTCNTGYTSSGSSVRICQSTGDWSGSDFTCTVVTCPIVRAPSDGDISCTPVSGTEYNTVCTFNCDTGYTPSGSSSRTCQSTGQWSGSEFTCTVVTCPAINAPSNGGMSCTPSGTDYDTVLCDADRWGDNCHEYCTCISGSSCNNVDGLCTECDHSECDKRNLQVSLNHQGIYTINYTDVLEIICSVNLPSVDVSVWWIAPNYTSDPVVPVNGVINLNKTDLPEVDSGVYGCYAEARNSVGVIVGNSTASIIVEVQRQTYHQFTASYSVHINETHTVPHSSTYYPTTLQYSEDIDKTNSVSAQLISSSTAIIIGVSAAVGALLIAIIATIVCVARRSNKLEVLETQIPTTDIMQDTNYIAKANSLVSKYEFPLNRLQYVSELGSGHFGVVYKAIASGIAGKKDALPVAVKKLKDTATSSQKEDMLREIQLLQEIGEHPNILGILGCCTSEEPYLLITEYMKYGDLKNFLWQSKKEFLANKKYVHGDLAARNILVGEDLLIKITDFGLTNDVYLRGWMDLPADTMRPIHWVSPETNLEGKCTMQSDVWSFGIVLYEIVTRGGRPYPGMTPREVLINLRNGYRMPKPHGCSPVMYELMTQCWQEDPEERPNFTQLRDRLNELLSQFADYLNNPPVKYINITDVPLVDNMANKTSSDEFNVGDSSASGYLSPKNSDEDNSVSESGGFADRQPYFTSLEPDKFTNTGLDSMELSGITTDNPHRINESSEKLCSGEDHQASKSGRISPP